MCRRQRLLVSPRVPYSTLLSVSATVLSHWPPYFSRIAPTRDCPSVIVGAAGRGDAGAGAWRPPHPVASTTPAAITAWRTTGRVMAFPSAWGSVGATTSVENYTGPHERPAFHAAAAAASLPVSFPPHPVPDRPAVLLLSGGLDSTTLVAV